MSEISPNNCSTFLFLSLSSESLMSVGGRAAATYRISSGKQKQNPVTYNDNSRSLQENHHQSQRTLLLLYILESNSHPFYSFRGLKNHMRIRIVCGLDSRSWAGFWKNDTSRCTCRKNNTIIYYFIYYLKYYIIYYIIFIIYYSSDSLSSFITDSLSVTQALSSLPSPLSSHRMSPSYQPCCVCTTGS